MTATGNLLIQFPAANLLNGNTSSSRLLQQRRQLPVCGNIGHHEFFYGRGTTRQQRGNGVQPVNLFG
jgi:hypothetical protein